MTPDLVLILESVSRHFGSGATEVRAVADASLCVRAGEVVAILGPSGSGKSTILSIMGGLLTPDRGDVVVDGDSLRRLSFAQLCLLRRERIGFIFQSFNLLKALSALENVAVGVQLAGASRREARRRAGEALAEVGLASRSRALPRDLSGGEQQRVAIARALVKKPTLILADEPTANLDSANGRMVTEMIRRHVHSSRAAAVIVTHDPRLVATVDRQVYMEDGFFKGAAHEAESLDRAAV